MWAQVFVVLSQFTRLIDRQTDRQTDSFLMAMRWITCSRTVEK